MNRKQKLALVVSVVVVALMGLYPPWKQAGTNSVPLEYAPIFSPPPSRSPENGLEVDLVRLFLQAGVVAIVSAGLIRAAAENPASDAGVASAPAKESGFSQDSKDQTTPSESESDAPASPVSAVTEEEIAMLEEAAAASGDGVVVRLPSSKKYGNFLVESGESVDYWEHHAEARGAVKLPLGKRVQLEVSEVEDVDLSFVSVLASNSIHSVDLSASKVRDWELANLTKLTDLRELDLSGTGVTSQAIGYIVALSSLEKLWLDETEIDDACVSNLTQFTALKKLSLKNTKVTPEAIAKLKDALGDCHIET